MTMFDPKVALLSRFLASIADEVAEDPASGEIWDRASQALGESREKEVELASAIDQQDAPALNSIVTQWNSGERHLPEQDREVLRRALKAFRKKIKVMRLDAESTIGGGATSGGRQSGIVGITPPDRFPREVWEELARQERLIDTGHGVYELVDPKR